jgi:hypothetical protein
MKNYPNLNTKNAMLWNKYPYRLDNFTLAAAIEDLQGDPPNTIPCLVWLLENPASPLSLPGKIDLTGHDCIHLLLKRGFRSRDEAYVVGFTMGNDTSTNSFHLLIFKVAAYYLYPHKYRLTYSELKIFDLGVRQGRRAKIENINQIDWLRWKHHKLRDIRLELGLNSKSRIVESTDLPISVFQQ